MTVKMFFFVACLFNLYLPGESKTVNDEFIVRVLPDNLWKLQLKKDGTYEYEHCSLFSDRCNMLDAGAYSISNGVVTFNSVAKSPKEEWEHKSMTLETIRQKRGLPHPRMSSERFSLIGNKFYVLKVIEKPDE